MSDWKQIGIIGVDAGLCWLGDPCYVLHNNPPPKAIGTSWSDFCDKLHQGEEQSTQFSHDLGHDGLGVCVSTGGGDGNYPVMAKFAENGQLSEVKVVFIDND